MINHSHVYITIDGSRWKFMKIYFQNHLKHLINANIKLKFLNYQQYKLK